MGWGWSRWRGGGRSRERAPEALAGTFRRALLAVLEGDDAAAEASLTEAVRLDSDDLEPYLALALLYRQRGEIGRAIRIHQNLLLRRDLAPERRVGVLADLAADFRKGGFLQRAIASYQEVLTHDARHERALEALTGLLTQMRDHQGSLAMSRRLAKVQGRRQPVDDASRLVALAAAEHAEGRHDAARKSVKRALRKDRKNVDGLVLLGTLEAERGRNKAALAAWRVVPEEGGSRAAELYPRIEASFAALGKAREYETFLRAILEQRPDDASARLALAGSLAARGDAEASLLEMRRVLDLDPSRVDARIALGRLLLAEHREPDVIKEYRELLALLEREAGGGSSAPPTAGGAAP